MDGRQNTFIHWFLFKEEPSYTIDFGPKNGCDVMVNQTLTQLKPQACYHGSFSYDGDAMNWQDDGIVDKISGLLHKNHPVYRFWEAVGENLSFTLNLFPLDFKYGDSYDYFDNLRSQACESEENMKVIECISELLRYAHNMKHWLGIVRKTFYRPM